MNLPQNRLYNYNKPNTNNPVNFNHKDIKNYTSYPTDTNDPNVEY